MRMRYSFRTLLTKSGYRYSLETSKKTMPLLLHIITSEIFPCNCHLVQLVCKKNMLIPKKLHCSEFKYGYQN